LGEPEDMVDEMMIATEEKTLMAFMKPENAAGHQIADEIVNKGMMGMMGGAKGYFNAVMRKEKLFVDPRILYEEYCNL